MMQERLAGLLRRADAESPGATWILQRLSEAPGCYWQEAKKTRFGRSKSSNCLFVGEWSFEPAVVANSYGLRMTHMVNGIRLAQTTGTVSALADQFAKAVCEVGASLGGNNPQELEMVIEGIEIALDI